jgi:hypothetical protein
MNEAGNKLGNEGKPDKSNDGGVKKFVRGLVAPFAIALSGAATGTVVAPQEAEGQESLKKAGEDAYKDLKRFEDFLKKQKGQEDQGVAGKKEVTVQIVPLTAEQRKSWIATQRAELMAEGTGVFAIAEQRIRSHYKKLETPLREAAKESEASGDMGRYQRSRRFITELLAESSKTMAQLERLRLSALSLLSEADTLNRTIESKQFLNTKGGDTELAAFNQTTSRIDEIRRTVAGIFPETN